MRPPLIGRRPVPPPPGLSSRCARCGELLGLAVQTVQLVRGRFVNVCRDRAACREREQARG